MIIDNDFGSHTLSYYNVKVINISRCTPPYYARVDFVLEDGRLGFFMQTSYDYGGGWNSFIYLEERCYVMKLLKFQNEYGLSRFCDNPKVVRVVIRK